MKILGIKTSHDGAMALIDNGKLIFSYEMEKLKNNARLKQFDLTLKEIQEILNDYGYSLQSLDTISIDGWNTEKQLVLESEQEENVTLLKNVKLGDLTTDLKLARYGKLVSSDENILMPVEGNIAPINLSYSSYMHVTGHLFCAYSTSPFAKDKQDSYILVWDHGMPPQLFYLHGADYKILNCGPLFLMFGGVYPEFACEFTPFDKLKNKDNQVSGKLMAYIALGKVNDEFFDQFFRIYRDLESQIINDINIKTITWVTRQFISQSKELFEKSDISSDDLLATFHVFLEKLLIEKLEERIGMHSYSTDNLCYVGGCALSIKWNSKIRNAGLFNNMWVPPFPNDAGSAIGAACCAMADKTGNLVLDWNVYTGPKVIDSDIVTESYSSKSFTVKELAELMIEKDEPVVVLNDRAELGPRSLGNRSIISPATNTRMKDVLNNIKGREHYRPVAPICLEADAPFVFTPGNPDPYMLFEHIVKSEWKDRVPAIVHLDGSARLQTVNEKENTVIYKLLTRYKEITGVPLLCNTSANFKGKGFFPDVRSVMEWDQVNYIWSNNILYERKKKLALFNGL